MRAGELHLADVADSGRHTVSLAGELDMVTASDLAAAVTGLCIDGASEITLDLEQLTFLDSTGLQAILLAREMCSDRGCEFALTGANAPVMRVFELTGTADLLPFRERRSPGRESTQPQPR